MNEHDSLRSLALNNMTVNMLVDEYAWLKLDNKKLYAALKAIANAPRKMANLEDTVDTLQQIARDAINAQGDT